MIYNTQSSVGFIKKYWINADTAQDVPEPEISEIKGFFQGETLGSREKPVDVSVLKEKCN